MKGGREIYMRGILDDWILFPGLNHQQSHHTRSQRLLLSSLSLEPP